MKILVDLDGVVADFNSAFARLLKRINPSIILDATAPDFPDCWNWPERYGYSKEDESKAWAEVKHSGVFWRSLFPYPNGYADVEHLNILQRTHEIYFVTSRPGVTAKRESEEWLRGMGFNGPTVIICDSHSKADFVQAVKIDMVIEDKPETLLDCNNTHTVLVRRPYNKGYWGYFNDTVDSVREAVRDV